MEPQDKLPPLKKLEEDIRRFRHRDAQKEPAVQGAGFAMRMGLELVSGVLTGAGIGILLDRWLGTSPFLLVICFLLGSAAGGLALYRTSVAVDGVETKTDESE